MVIERLISDDDSIISVQSSYGNPIRFWDDGFGPLWVYRETMGVVGIVRALTWELAYECVIDEIMMDADETDPDNQPDKEGNLPEGIHYRGNGIPSNDGLDSPLAASDLNGEALDELTPELFISLELSIILEDSDNNRRTIRTKEG